MKKRQSRLSENLAPYLADDSRGVTKLSISLPNDLVEEVRRTARERRTSVSATIGAALRRALTEDQRRLDAAIAAEIGDPLVAGESKAPISAADTADPLVAGESKAPISAADTADLAAFRGRSLGGLVDEALGEWLATRGIRLSPVRDDEWRRRLQAFFQHRRVLAEERGWTDQEVQSDVDAAVKEAREARAARRR
jgi:hypothetical protein